MLFNTYSIKCYFCFPAPQDPEVKSDVFATSMQSQIWMEGESDAEVLEDREAMTNMPHKFGIDDADAFAVQI